MPHADEIKIEQPLLLDGHKPVNHVLRDIDRLVERLTEGRSRRRLPQPARPRVRHGVEHDRRVDASSLRREPQLRASRYVDVIVSEFNGARFRVPASKPVAADLNLQHLQRRAHVRRKEELQDLLARRRVIVVEQLGRAAARERSDASEGVPAAGRGCRQRVGEGGLRNARACDEQKRDNGKQQRRAQRRQRGARGRRRAARRS